MEFVGRLLRFLIELTALGWMLVTNSLCFMALCTRSRAALTAENVFLRKQLAFYQERKVVPRRFDNASRYLLVLLSRFFAWRDCLGECHAEDVGWLAPSRLSAVLALEVSSWTPSHSP